MTHSNHFLPLLPLFPSEISMPMAGSTQAWVRVGPGAQGVWESPQGLEKKVCHLLGGLVSVLLEALRPHPRSCRNPGLESDRSPWRAGDTFCVPRPRTCASGPSTSIMWTGQCLAPTTMLSALIMISMAPLGRVMSSSPQSKLAGSTSVAQQPSRHLCPLMEPQGPQLQGNAASWQQTGLEVSVPDPSPGLAPN